MLQQLVDYLLKNQIIFALVLIILGWTVFQLRDILALIFIAYIIMAALQPASWFLRKSKFPHILAVFLPYLAIFAILFLLIFPLVPFTATQITSLATGLPGYIKQTGNVVGFHVDQNKLQSYADSVTGYVGQNALSLTSQVFGGVISILTMLIISFYLLLDRERLRKSFAALFHKNTRPQVIEALDRIDDKLGAWLRGQLLLSFSIGLATYIALLVIQFPYALPLALIAGILEILPTIGPIVSAIPAIVVAFTISPTTVLLIVAIYIAIQTLEANLLVPKIMQHAVGLNPLVVIIGIMIGANLMGISGALLAIPFISFVIVLYDSLQQIFDGRDT